MEVLLMMKLVSSIALLGAFSWLLYLFSAPRLNAEWIRRKLRVQGIRGPPPSFLYGNLSDMQRIQSQALLKAPSSKSNHSNQLLGHDYTATLFPYLEQWRKEYGLLYTYSTGMKQHLYINAPELVRDLNQSNTLDLGKPSYLTKKFAPMLGNGVLRANGLFWAHQRKLVAAEFFMNKVKGMVGDMIESTEQLVRKWEQFIEEQEGGTAEVRVDEDLRGLSADIISKICFGHSYLKGKEVFQKLRTMQKVISKQGPGGVLFGVGGFRKKQDEISRLEKEVESLIWEMVEKRKRECSSEKDLVQSLLEAAMSDQSLGKELSKKFIVDNCKNIYFAGHETTAIATSWSLMLLGLHPEWQAQIRTEVAEFVPNGVPDAHSLPQLKTMDIVIHEVLRLYPPAAFVSREVYEDTQIGNLKVPKGVCLWTLIPTLHRDPDNWGPDANEFKPERFSGGVSKACKYPQAYAPFGLGPRLCLGKNFAMVELKVVLAIIISKFSFSLSPSYKHSPIYRMTVEPEHGVPILIRKI